MISLLRHIPFALLLVALAVVPVQAELRGSLEWNWADYQRDDGKTGQEIDASSFLQTYSVLYEQTHLINSGQAGYWNGALGYQWSSLSNSVNGQDGDIDKGKILYNGELVFAPGGLPLRLHLFSHDLTTAEPGGGLNTLLLESAPSVVREMSGLGENRTTGLTMWAGIKNGSYLGKYREVLSQLPKLLIDYREDYVRDLESLSEQHYRLRDLAFVSLNKKDNWFHYRVSEYTDFINSDNDYEDRVYMIGTVDHTLARQWINLTNWIQLSVDGSLIQETGSGGVGTDSYLLNLFTRMNRRDWRLQNFNSMERVTNNNGLIEKYLDLPVFAQGQLDPRTKWRMSLIQSSEEKLLPGESVWNEHLFYTTYQLESQRASGNILTSNVAFDVKRGSLDDTGQAARFNVELRTDGRRDLVSSWLIGYGLGWFASNETGDDFVEQELSVAIDSRPGPSIRYGGKQRLSLGLGSYQAYSTEYLRPVSSNTVANEDIADHDLDGPVWRSTTGVYLELISSSKWKQRFVADFDYIDRNIERTSQLSLGHNLRYDDREFWVAVNTVFETGDEIMDEVSMEELGSVSRFIGEADHAFLSEASFNYAPRRSWSTGGEAMIFWGKGDLNDAWAAQVIQRADYSLFSSYGTRRKLMALQQQAIYERLFGAGVDDTYEKNPWYAGFQVAATFYPYRFLTLGTRVEYRYYGLDGAGIINYGADVSIPFEKMTITLAYEYGQADDTWIENPGLKEQRWEVDIKKTF